MDRLLSIERCKRVKGEQEELRDHVAVKHLSTIEPRKRANDATTKKGSEKTALKFSTLGAG